MALDSAIVQLIPKVITLSCSSCHQWSTVTINFHPRSLVHALSPQAWILGQFCLEISGLATGKLVFHPPQLAKMVTEVHWAHPLGWWSNPIPGSLQLRASCSCFSSFQLHFGFLAMEQLKHVVGSQHRPDTLPTFTTLFLHTPGGQESFGWSFRVEESQSWLAGARWRDLADSGQLHLALSQRAQLANSTQEKAQAASHCSFLQCLQVCSRK